jgi:hypothetical protein
MLKGSFESNVTNPKWHVTLALGASNQILHSSANQNRLGNQVDYWKFWKPMTFFNEMVSVFVIRLIFYSIIS